MLVGLPEEKGAFAPFFYLTKSLKNTTFDGITGAVKWRYYRSFIENLTTSGRDPATVLDADYARTVARGVFS